MRTILLAAGICVAAAPTGAEEPVPPPTYHGVRMVETPAEYLVELKIARDDGRELMVNFKQYNFALDRKRLASQWDEYDAKAQHHYLSAGFKPLEAMETICPPGITGGWSVDANDPTARQICGGFALAPMLGGTFHLSTDSVWNVLQQFGNPVEAMEAGDILVFYSANPEHKCGAPAHYALVENANGLLSTILTKNQFERAYRGSLTRYLSQVADTGAPGLGERDRKTLAWRINGGDLEFVVYRLPYARMNVTRLGRLHADERPPQLANAAPLRVQIVDPRNYELLPSAVVTLSFAGQTDPQVSGETDQEGQWIPKTLPGGGGEFDVRGELTGYKPATLRVTVDSSRPVNLILALEPDSTNRLPREQLAEFQSRLEDLLYQQGLKDKVGDVEGSNALQPPINQLKKAQTQIMDQHPELLDFLLQISVESVERLEKKLGAPTPAPGPAASPAPANSNTPAP